MLVMTAETIDRPRVIRVSLAAAVLVLVALLAFSGALQELVGRWIRQDEYSHGFFIPLITAWLLWARRDALRASIGQPSWWGPVVVLIAILMHIVGELSAFYLLSQVGFVLALMGIALGIGGFSLLKVAFIPLFFLLFAIPLPYFIDSVLSFRLQLISSELGVFFIRLFQIPVYLEGNVIDLGAYKLQVVEACSGLRYLYPLLSLGFLAAYLFQAPLWQRIVVFLSTIPITIVMNSFRIAMVGVLVDRWGTEQAEGLLHLFEGWIIFLACGGLLAAEMWVFARLGSGKSFFQVFYLPKVAPVEPRSRRWSSLSPVPIASCLLLLCVAGVTVFYLSGRSENIPDRSRFATFPTSIGAWQGRPSLLEPQVEHALGLEDYVLTDYTKGKTGAVNLYVAYYASQRKGTSPHSPIVCIPGGGWHINDFARLTYTGASPELSLPFNRVVIEKGSSRQIVVLLVRATWQEGRQRVLVEMVLVRRLDLQE